MKTTQIFETETCTRCGGTGRYSYCQMYGDTCFRCKGATKTYTKRGQIARQYYNSLASLTVDKLTPGMVIWFDNAMGKSSWVTIQSIHPDALNPGMTTVECDKVSMGTYPSMTYRVRQDGRQRATKMELAIILERSLTKSGKRDTRLVKLVKEIAYA